MHKCQCGREFEGGFCPECGTKWQEEKTCPKCGAKLQGSVKFCQNCGYSFVKAEKPAENKKSFNFSGWLKSHLKIVVPLAVVIALIIILSCSIPACVAAQTNGTYYKLMSNGEIDKATFFVLNSGKWEDEDGESGTYKKSGENVTFFTAFFGETEELTTGTLKDYVLKVENVTYISEKHKHTYGEWTVTEATCTSAGANTRACGNCGFKETQVLEKIDHTLSDWKYDYNYHWKECSSGCDLKYETAQHSGASACTVCKYHYGDTIVLEGVGIKLELNNKKDGHIVAGLSADSKITEIIIPAEYIGLPVKAIGDYAFKGCSSLTSITIPDSVTSIGKEAFFGCSALTSIAIPDSISSIGTKAFFGCSKIKSLSIGKGLDSIDETTFSSCSSLETITVDNNNQSYKSNSNCLLTKDGKTLIRGTNAGIIPDGVTSIVAFAFSGCSSLTSITIPAGITSIKEGVFNDCSSLTSITIPDGVTSIGAEAFVWCSSLTSINFKGTKAQWNTIKFYPYWNSNTGKYTVHCTDGDIVRDSFQ